MIFSIIFIYNCFLLSTCYRSGMCPDTLCTISYLILTTFEIGTIITSLLQMVAGAQRG